MAGKSVWHGLWHRVRSFVLPGRPPRNLGLHAGKLAPCPNRPNCVSSHERGRWFIPPITYAGDREQAYEAARRLLVNQGGTPVVEERPSYLRAECRSRLLGFIDDVELYLPRDEAVIHLRSASRLGYWDLGVNRARLNRLRTLLAKCSGSLMAGQ